MFVKHSNENKMREKYKEFIEHLVSSNLPLKIVKETNNFICIEVSIPYHSNYNGQITFEINNLPSIIKIICKMHNNSYSYEFNYKISQYTMLKTIFDDLEKETLPKTSKDYGNITKAINLAKHVNSFFWENKVLSVDYMSQLYELVRVEGCQVLLNMPALDCQVVGLAFARQALFYDNGDRDFNSVAAENAFYCLAKSYFEADNSFGLPALFTILVASPRLLTSKSYSGMDFAVNKATELSINNVYLQYSLYNSFRVFEFFDLCKYYLLNIFYDIENKKFNIPADLPYLLPTEDVILSFLSEEEKIKDFDKMNYLVAGELLFEGIYREIEDTLLKF